jgi:catalase
MPGKLPVGYRLPVAASDSIANQLVEVANALFGVHEGRRALHAKGVFCEGTFTATPAAAALCRATIFSGSPVPAVIRLSNGGGRPDSNDAAREARGLAVKLRPAEGEEADILGTTTPAFVVRTPEDFLELLQLRRPAPQTGEPDLAALGDFLGKHPEAQTAIAATMGSEPPLSFATLVYFSPHSFRMLDADGNATWIRYRWRPEAGEHRIPDDEAEAKGRDYLFEDLTSRLADGPIVFDLLLQLAGDDDPIDDPTAVWPDARELVEAGRLEITAQVDDPEVDGNIEVFDPTRVPDGIELSADPILHARRAAYSASAYKRLGMEIGPVP